MRSAIAYYGAKGSFTHQAVLKNYPGQEYHQFLSFNESVKSVADSVCDLALLPFQNTNSKSIDEMQRCLLSYVEGVSVTDLLSHHIEHYVYSFGQLSDIQEVRTKVVVFDQTEGWLQANLPNVRRNGDFSTSEAVKSLAAEPENKTLCAIGSLDAQEYGVPIVASRIQTEPNFTLFAKIEKSSDLCPDFDSCHSALVAIDDYDDASFERLTQILARTKCYISYNWIIKKTAIDPQVLFFEISSIGHRGALKEAVGSLVSTFGGARFVGAYSGKNMAFLLTSSLQHG